MWLGRCYDSLIIFSLMTTSLECAPTEMGVVGTRPHQYPEKDGVAWLHIAKFPKLTVCMRFKITQYYNLFGSVHPLIELSKANRIWAVTNKCHQANKDCTTGFIKRFKDDYKLGKTFGLFIYNYKFQVFDSWLPGQWNSFCISLDQTRGYYGVFLNGQKSLEFPGLTTDYASPVPLLNGRCCCAPLHGSLTDLNVWSSVLAEEEVAAWSDCRVGQGGDVVDWRRGELDTELALIRWSNATLNISKLHTDKLYLEDICSRQNARPTILKTFSVLKDYQGNLDFCRNIGGEMAVARDNESLTEMIRAVEAGGGRRCGDKFWAGYSDQAEETVWRDPQGGRLSWDNWQPGEPNNFGDEEDCAVVGPEVGPGTRTKFNDFSCSTRLLCSTCRLDLASLPSFQLAGLCQESQADSFYSWSSDLARLEGFISSQLAFSRERERWEVTPSLNTSWVLAFTNQTRDFPLGKHPWYFLDSLCTDQGENYRALNLHLDVEQPGNFCCDDGTCISSELVCDNVAHCSNNQDETDCHILRIPEYYDTSLPPFDVRKAENGETELKYAEVSVAFTVLDILDVNEQNSEFEIYFMIQLSWNDFKLEFEFLKDVEDKNLIKNVTRIWTPNL